MKTLRINVLSLTEIISLVLVCVFALIWEIAGKHFLLGRLNHVDHLHDAQFAG